MRINSRNSSRNPIDDNSCFNRYFLEIQKKFYFEVLKILNFQKPLNLLMKFFK